MKMCEIGSKLLMSGANVTGVVDRLEKKGLVRRVMDAEDRRLFLIHLTEDGSRLIAKIFPLLAAQIEAFTGVLTSKEKRQLTELLKKLGKAEEHKKTRHQ
jgi:MarR family 2-MHQ and catechol resistance regulon transcriptional repressor